MPRTQNTFNNDATDSRARSRGRTSTPDVTGVDRRLRSNSRATTPDTTTVPMDSQLLRERRLARLNAPPLPWNENLEMEREGAGVMPPIQEEGPMDDATSAGSRAATDAPLMDGNERNTAQGKVKHEILRLTRTSAHRKQIAGPD